MPPSILDNFTAFYEQNPSSHSHRRYVASPSQPTSDFFNAPITIGTIESTTSLPIQIANPRKIEP